MPLIDSIISLNGIEILLWDATESSDELISLCHYRNIKVDTSILSKAESRRREILAEALILSEYFSTPKVLLHDENGAPIVDGYNGFISISHTHGLVAVAFSHYAPIGIDAERISERVMKVRDKFINDEEAQFIVATDSTENTLAWTAKEAIYKLVNTPGASLRNDFHICSRFRKASVDHFSADAYIEHSGNRRLISISSILCQEQSTILTVAVYL